VALWNRPERIVDVVRMLSEQDADVDIDLYLWNNNRGDHQFYVSECTRIMAEASISGSIRSIVLARSPINVGSIGRFYWARHLPSVSEPDDIVVVIDDDEDLERDFVSTALAHARPDRISAWWSWTVPGDDYWHRTPARLGDQVDHIGPGGAVVPRPLVAHRRFFTRLPDEYRMLDDLWLSAWARAHGVELAHLPVEISFVLDETNQFHGQASIKPEFYRALQSARAREWLSR